MLNASEDLDNLINELIDVCGMPETNKPLAYNYFMSMTRSELAERIKELRLIQDDFLTYKRDTAPGFAAEAS